MGIKKKIASILENGLDPVAEGYHNFRNPKQEIEDLAKERLDTCINCLYFLREPISFFRVQDEKLPHASERMCDACGCTISYKIRQTKTKCDKWQH